MTEEEARRAGWTVSIGAAAGDGAPSGRRVERIENIAERNAKAEEDVPTPQPVPQTTAPAPEPEPARVEHAPEPEPVLAVPTKTLEEQIAEAKQLLASVGIETRDQSDPTAPAPGEPQVVEVVVWRDGLSPREMLSLLKRPCIAVRAWRETVDLARCFNNAITGMRSVIFLLALGLLGMLDALQTIDVRAVIKMLLPSIDDVGIGNILTLMSLVGVLLRLLTTTSIFRAWRRPRYSRGDGLAPGVGTGSVDEPYDPA